MKWLQTLIGFFLFMSFVAAQQPITTSGVDFKLGEDEYQGVQVLIPEADFEQVEKDWVKVLQKGTKSEVAEDHDGEFTIFGAYFKSLSEDPVNIYSQIIPRDSTIELNTCVELKRNVFLTEDLYESEFNQLRDYLKDFGKEVYIEVVSDDVKAEDNILKELEKELKKLQNEMEAINKEITKNQHDITISEDAITITDSDISVKNEQIARQKVQLQSINDDPVQKATVKEAIKSLEKEKKKMQKSVQKEKKKIVGYQSDIDNAKIDIPSMEAQQLSKREEIEIQRGVLNNVATKLETIKNY